MFFMTDTSALILSLFHFYPNDYSKESILVLGFNYLLGMTLAIFAAKFFQKILSNKSVTQQFFKAKTVLYLASATFALSLVFFILNLTIEAIFTANPEVVNITNLIFSIFGLLIIMIFFILYKALIRESHLFQRKIELEQLQKYCRHLEEKYSEYSRFHHDYLNMHLGMADYFTTKDYAGLEVYFNQHIKPTSLSITTNFSRLQSIKNIRLPELKGLMFIKLLQAQELGIEVYCEIPELIESISLNTLDLCTAVGILLDNAIEAASESINGLLTLSLLLYPDKVLFTFENSFIHSDLSLHELYELGKSTKGTHRGLGLTTLASMTENHLNFVLDTAIEEQVFVQKLTIYTVCPKKGINSYG